jgi:P27 family predicted phage terminase small subunit
MTPKAPTHLGKDGKALWSALTDEYGIADSGGLALVTTAAECLDRMRAAQALIKKHGECFEDRYGGLKANPACKIELDSRNGMLAALKMLNLDVEPLRDRPGRPAGHNLKAK